VRRKNAPAFSSANHFHVEKYRRHQNKQLKQPFSEVSIYVEELFRRRKLNCERFMTDGDGFLLAKPADGRE
jgi:hypothetical protein